jgi:hypothetical protein
MGYDLKRSHFSLVLEKSVQAGSVITEEGVLLQSVLDPATGTEVVLPTSGSGDVIAGFAIRDNADHATTSEVESVTVPSSAPYEVQLRQNNLVAGTPGTGSTTSLSAMDGSTQMDNIDVGGAVSGDVNVNDVTGLLAFHVDEASKTIVVTYRYNLTVAESRLKFYQRNINNEASTLFSQVGVGQGHGEIFTDQFDATVDWAAATSVNSGVDGVIRDSTGTALDARVISVPNVNNPLLGISFDIGGIA